jgi:hypothetical protein
VETKEPLTPTHLQAYFIFSQRTKQTQKKIKRACKRTHTTVQGFVRTSNGGAMNVNRLEQSVCGLQAVVLRGESSSMRIT